MVSRVLQTPVNSIMDTSSGINARDLSILPAFFLRGDADSQTKVWTQVGYAQGEQGRCDVVAVQDTEACDNGHVMMRGPALPALFVPKREDNRHRHHARASSFDLEELGRRD